MRANRLDVAKVGVRAARTGLYNPRNHPLRQNSQPHLSLVAHLSQMDKLSNFALAGAHPDSTSSVIPTLEIAYEEDAVADGWVLSNVGRPGRSVARTE
jgi:hypothetical protein